MQTLKKIAVVLALVPMIAMAQEVDADKTGAIDELFAVSKADKQIQSLAEGLQSQSKQESFFILEKALREDKNLSPEKKQTVAGKLDKNGAIKRVQESAGKVFATEAFRKDVKKSYYEAYAKNFSTKEIRDIVAFFKTDSGQAYLAKWDKAQQDTGAPVMKKYVPQSQESTLSLAKKEIAAVAK